MAKKPQKKEKLTYGQAVTDVSPVGGALRMYGVGKALQGVNKPKKKKKKGK